VKQLLALGLIVVGFTIVGPLLGSSPPDQEIPKSISVLLLGLLAIVIGGYYFFGYDTRRKR